MSRGRLMTSRVDSVTSPGDELVLFLVSPLGFCCSSSPHTESILSLLCTHGFSSGSVGKI